MAQDALLAALDDDARAQAESIIRSAEEEAAALIAAAVEEAGIMLEHMLAEAGRSFDRSRAELMNGARVRAAAALMDCRRGLMEEVFERSTRSFSALDRTEYGRILNLWYDELKAAWDEAGMPGEPVVIVNPVDLELIGERGALLRPDPLLGHGLVFVSGDGRVRFENTFSSRLYKSKEDLMPLLDRILFSSEAHLDIRSQER